MSKTKEITFESPIKSRILYEIGFWWHLVVWLPFYVLPFFIPLWANASLVVFYKILLLKFDGCVFTLIQQKMGILPPGLEYYEAVGLRLFNYRLSPYKTYLITELTQCYFLSVGIIMFLVK
jgi:hypothetical protein